MDVYTFDPLVDSRWSRFVAQHPNASIFHSAAWLTALQRTYGFAPLAFTTSPPAETLANALVFCLVRSRLTGNRLVSLPFSDHCEPLTDDPEQLRVLCAAVARERARERWKYAELRPERGPLPVDAGFAHADTYWLHRVDLRPSLDALLHSFHKDSIQRKIRRAEREGLRHEEGRSEALLHQFCRLLELTRERHGVPMQPLAWFRNLMECAGDSLSIRIASKDGAPAAGILTLSHRDRVV